MFDLNVTIEELEAKRRELNRLKEKHQDLRIYLQALEKRIRAAELDYNVGIRLYKKQLVARCDSRTEARRRNKQGASHENNSDRKNRA